MSQLPRGLRERLDALGAPEPGESSTAASYFRMLVDACAMETVEIGLEEALFHATRLVEEQGMVWEQALFETVMHVLASQGWDRREGAER